MPGTPASFIQAAANILDQFKGAPNGQLGRLWQTVNPWVTRFLASAATKWLPILANEAPCQIASPDGQGGWIPCPHPAVSFCDCCGKPTCLHHGRVDANAGVICFPCVATACAVARATRAANGGHVPPPREPGSKKEAPPPPKKKMPRAAALKALGLPASASDEEIKLAYKAMVKKWHPDKHATADKATAQARFLEVQAAWDALKP